MEKNETAVVTIEDMGVNGEGIGKLDGYTLFIKDAVIGDVVEAKLIKGKKNYGYARLMKVITPSQDRVPAKCEYARKCGGCQIQELSYEKQLEFKNGKVRENLQRIGGFSNEKLDAVMKPIIGMDEPFSYRNKAQFPVGYRKVVDPSNPNKKTQSTEPITGFYASRTHDIIANTDCVLGVPVNEDVLNAVLKYMKESKVKAYDELTGKGLIRHILIRYGFTSKEIMVCVNEDVLNAVLKYMKESKVKAYDELTGKGLIRHILIRYGFTSKEIMVCLVINGPELLKSEQLVEELVKIEGMTSITFSKNTSSLREGT